MTNASWTFEKFCRVAAYLGVALWIISLFCPSYVTTYDDGFGYDYGWELLLFGWFGALGSLDYALELGRYEGAFLGGVAWVANIFLLWNLSRMRRSRAPIAVVAVLGVAFAVLGLQPLYPGLFDRDRDVDGMVMPVVGAYIWAASMLPPVAMMFVYWWHRAKERAEG